MSKTRLHLQRQQPSAPRLRDGNFCGAPSRGQIRRAHYTHHRISPAQPLLQPLTPRLTQRDAISQIPIKEHLMTSLDQPVM